MADTNNARYPASLGLGNHGNALLFAKPGRWGYWDANGGAPNGTVYTKPLDLRRVENPTLSFSSYFLTEDARDRASWREHDLKIVEVRNRIAGTETWGPWNEVANLSQMHEGNGAWRGVHLGLQEHAGKEVQVRFRFDAVDEFFNYYTGWAIDDVIIGHDADTDGLADEYERRQTLTARLAQYSNARTPDGNQTYLFAPQSQRPAAQHHLLIGRVAHADPLQLNVSVGLLYKTNEYGFNFYSAERTLYNGTQSIATTCTAGRISNLLGLTTRTDPVDQRPDGLDIFVDLRTCGFPEDVWQYRQHWYLKVQDVQVDEEEGSIETLTLYTAGSTLVRSSDTDVDGIMDRQELASFRDSINNDLDADGVHEQIDDVQFAPTKSSVFNLYSQDFEASGYVILEGMESIVSSMEIRIKYDGIPEPQAATTHKLGTRVWIVDAQATRASTPGAGAVQWWDVRFTQEDDVVTEYRVYMEERFSRLQPVSLVGELRRQSSGERNTFNATLPGSAAPTGEWVGFTVSGVLEREDREGIEKVLDTAGDAFEALEALKAGKAANPISFALGLLVPTQMNPGDWLIRAGISVSEGEFDAQYVFMDNPEVDVWDRPLNGTSEHFYVQRKDDARFRQQTGLHDDTLGRMFYETTPARAVNNSGVWRYFLVEDGTASRNLTIFTTFSTINGKVILDVWRWEIPKNPADWMVRIRDSQQKLLDLESLLWLEGRAWDTLLAGYAGNVFELTPCLSACPGPANSRALVTKTVFVTDSDFLTPRSADDVDVSSLYFGSVAGQYARNLHDDSSINQTVGQYVVGMSMAAYTSKLAGENAIAGDPGARIEWYWGDGDTCNSLLPPIDQRKCATPLPAANLIPPVQGASDAVRNFKLQWTQMTDVDAVASQVFFYDGQPHDLGQGRNPVYGGLAHIHQQTGTLLPEDADSIRVAYDGVTSVADESHEDFHVHFKRSRNGQ